MFNHIEKRHIDGSVRKARDIARGLTPEVRKQLKFIIGTFHENPEWEHAFSNWEEILLNAAIAEDEGEKFHENLVSIAAMMFCIGFDTGLQFEADTVTERLLKNGTS